MNFFVSEMDAYKRWVRRNKEYVHSLESLANVSPSQFLVISLFFFVLVLCQLLQIYGQSFNI